VELGELSCVEMLPTSRNGREKSGEGGRLEGEKKRALVSSGSDYRLQQGSH
jgi:hypothetical protein